MAFAIAGPSTILASIVFHCAPNAADPSGVIRLTTCAGGSDGGICGRGGGVGAAVGGAGPSAVDIDAIIIWTATSATYPASLPRLLLCIFLSLFSQSAISITNRRPTVDEIDSTQSSRSPLGSGHHRRNDYETHS